VFFLYTLYLIDFVMQCTHKSFIALQHTRMVIQHVCDIVLLASHLQSPCLLGQFQRTNG
jgi:hypothetical protein